MHISASVLLHSQNHRKNVIGRILAWIIQLKILTCNFPTRWMPFDLIWTVWQTAWKNGHCEVLSYVTKSSTPEYFDHYAIILIQLSTKCRYRICWILLQKSYFIYLYNGRADVFPMYFMYAAHISLTFIEVHSCILMLHLHHQKSICIRFLNFPNDSATLCYSMARVFVWQTMVVSVFHIEIIPNCNLKCILWRRNLNIFNNQ